MQHGLWLRNTGDLDSADLVDRAVAAEEAGWDGVFVSDSLPFADYPDPWVLLAGMAVRTESIRLGTWVVPVPRRLPWQLAQEVATLDQLSDGRVVFGAGLGNDDDYDAYGRRYDLPALGDRYDEALEVIDGLWGDDPFSHDGEHFTMAAAELEPTPVQSPVSRSSRAAGGRTGSRSTAAPAGTASCRSGRRSPATMAARTARSRPARRLRSSATA